MRISIIFSVLLLTGCVVNLKNEKSATNIIHVDLRYNYPAKNELNTFEGYYAKETAPGHFARTNDFLLDPGQQLLILNKALTLHFFQMPASFHHTQDSDTETHTLRIRADSLDRTISWHGSIDALRPDTYHPDQLF